MSAKSFAGKSESMSVGSVRSVLQEVRFVGADGAAEAEEREDDGEADGDLGGLGGDDEEGEHLAGVRGVVRACARG